MLNAQHDETHEAGMARRVDRMAKQFAGFERNQFVVLESLAMFIRYYLTLTAPTPKALLNYKDKILAVAPMMDGADKSRKSVS